MPYQTCPTSIDDQQTILELWQRNLPTAVAERYGWLYREGGACDWTLQDEHQVAVGSVGLMQRRFHVRDHLVTAGQAVDMNVDHAHRSLGPALLLQRKVIEAACEQDLPFVYGLCDRRSELVLRRAGYHLLGDVARWVKPLTSEPFLPQLRCWKRLQQPGCAIADTLLWFATAEVWQRRPSGARAEVVDRFDERFDALWRRAARRFSILGDRSAAFLNWRFAESPAVRYRTFTLSDGENRLQGYLVYHFKSSTAHVADFLYDEPSDLAVLLGELLRFARRQGMESVVVESLIPESIARILKRFGFWRRPSNWTLLVYAPKATESQWRDEGLFELQTWYLTRADVDTDS